MKNSREIYEHSIQCLERYGNTSEGSISEFLQGINQYIEELKEKNQALRDRETKDLNKLLELQDKLSRRNMQIKELKKTISELNEGLGKLKKDFEDYTTSRSVTFEEEAKLNR